MAFKICVVQRWPLWRRLAMTGLAFSLVHLLQVPLEREIPGEPFLLFVLVVLVTALAFGTRVALVGVGLSTLLSLYFFEPFNTLAIHHASDLIKIQVYAIVASGCAVAVGYLGNALIAASEETEALKRLDVDRSILLRELAHGVANNFSAVAALMTIKAGAVTDTRARSVLNEAIEQVTVMGRVHRQLRTADQKVSLDSAVFFSELCDDFREIVRGRPLLIECKADSYPLSMDQAVLLGLIVNELVTNSVKHAFPDGRAGHIRVGFALKDQLLISVEDDGVGFDGRIRCDAGMGQGQGLVRGLSDQLEGDLEVASAQSGSTFRLSIPIARSPTSPRSSAVSKELLN